MTRYAATYALPCTPYPCRGYTPLAYSPSRPLSFASPKKDSRVAMLYAKYLGINGSLFDLKILSLQLMMVVLQVCG